MGLPDPLGIRQEISQWHHKMKGIFLFLTQMTFVSPIHCPFSDPSVIRLFGYTQWYHVNFPNWEVRRTSHWNETVDLRLVHYAC